jgi:alcohol dehydrogenase (cytochrome c)
LGPNAVKVAGVLATAGDLVFTANGEGVVFALDASTGEEVWQMRLGGPVGMAPITYLYEGRQQLAVISSSSLFVMDLAGQ